MKITEIIIGSLLATGLLLKMFHIPGGAIFSVLFANLLAIFYLVASFLLFKTDENSVDFDSIPYKKPNSLRILGSIATGISLSTTIIGILFKMMHWPGSIVMLLAGLFSLLVISIISVIKYSKNKSPYYEGLGYRLAIIGGMGTIVFFI
ncbi:MAG: hypothetical protein ABWY22_05190 [Flavobacterium sp.]